MTKGPPLAVGPGGAKNNDDDLLLFYLESELARLQPEIEKLLIEFEPPELPEIETGYLLESG